MSTPIKSSMKENIKNIDLISPSCSIKSYKSMSRTKKPLKNKSTNNLTTNTSKSTIDLVSPSKSSSTKGTPTKNNLRRESLLLNKKKKIQEQINEISSNLESLKKTRTRLKAKQTELDKPPVVPSNSLPEAICELPFPQELTNDLLSVWDFLTSFRKQLSLTHMTINDLIELLTYTASPSVALTEIFISLLRVLISDAHTCNRLNNYIPKHLHFSYRYDRPDNEPSEVDLSIDSNKYDIISNCFHLIPNRLHIYLIDSLRYQSILRAIIMRLEPVIRLRKAAAQYDLAHSKTSQLKQRLSLNMKYIRLEKTCETLISHSDNKQIKDYDAIFTITSNPINILEQLIAVVIKIDNNEIYQLSCVEKLLLIKTLCDSCIETSVFNKLIDRNIDERTNKLNLINKEIKEKKLKSKEKNLKLKEIALQLVKQNLNKSSIIPSNKRIRNKISSNKSIEPTASQIQSKLDELIVLEANGIDVVVDSITLDVDDERPSKRKRNQSSNDHINIDRLHLIDDSNTRLLEAKESGNEPDVRAAIKYAVKNGLRWVDSENGKVYCTELLKDVYQLLYNLEATARENKLQYQSERALLDYPIKTESLGRDRYNRDYYLFNEDYRLYVQQHVLLSNPLNSQMDIQLDDQLGFQIDSKVNNNFNSLLNGLLDPSSLILYQHRPSKWSMNWKYYGTTSEIFELIHSLDNKLENEKELKLNLSSKLDIQEPDVVYSKTGSEFIGRKVRRLFKDKRPVEGTIVGWLPQHEDDVALWRVLHLDGDEEDLELHEVLEALIPENTISLSNSVTSNTTIENVSDTSNEPIKQTNKKLQKSSIDCNSNEEAEFDVTENNDKGDNEDEDDVEKPPKIITSYYNNYRHSNAVKCNQIGITGLTQHLFQAHTAIAEKLKKTTGYNRDVRKIWETSIKESETLPDLIQCLLQLELIVYNTQTVKDRLEEDEIIKAKELKHQSMLSEGWLFTDPNEYINRNARRFFPRYGRSDGKIIAYLPSDINDGIGLWRMIHIDGDEEDLEENDVIKACQDYDNNLLDDDQIINSESDSTIDDDITINDSNKISNQLTNQSRETLWQTSGIRSRWIKAVNDSKTISEVSLALSALIEHSITFGAVDEEYVDKNIYNFVTNIKTTDSSNKRVDNKSRNLYDELNSRPIRQAVKKVKSYYDM